MAKVAEFAHYAHTPDPRFGRAPYYDPRALNFVQVDARRRFIEALNDLARPALESLLELAGACDCDAATCPFNEWARQFGLTKNGTIADWLLYPARLTVQLWRAIPATRVPFLLNFQAVELSVSLSSLPPETCRITSPEVAWNPLGPAFSVPGAVPGETRAQCRERIMALVDAELGRIERSMKARRLRPCPVKRGDQHFEWAVRFQVNAEPIRALATTLEHQRTVRAAITGLLSLILLDQRIDRPGRPRETAEMR